MSDPLGTRAFFAGPQDPPQSSQEQDLQRLVEQPFRMLVEAAHQRQAGLLPAGFHGKVPRLIRDLRIVIHS